MALDIVHKKSGVSQRLPVASDLGLGEIALNYNADGPFLTCKDTAGNVRKINNIWVSATAPTGASPGDPWLDTSVNPARLYIYKDASSQFVPVVNVNAATTSSTGTVILASSSDITNGTSGRVVDAAQLQSEISSFLIGVTPVAPLAVGGAATQPSVSITPGAANQVLQTNSSGNAVEFTSNINLPGTLGVTGATTLSSTLGVTGTGSAAAPSFSFGDNDTGIYRPGANQVAITTGGTERLRINSSGNVGIGTTSPGYELEIGGSLNIQLALTANTTTGNSQIYFGDSADDDAGALVYRHDGDSLAFNVNAAERMRLDSSGRLLVSTSSPSGSSSLQVAGKIATLGLDSAFGSDSIPTIYRSGSTSGSYPFDNFGHLIIQPRADGNPRDIVFATGNGGANKTVIDSSGRVGIGDSAPNVEFSLKGTSDVISRVQATDQSNARVRIQAGNASSSYLEFGDSDDDDVGEIVYGHSDNHMRFRTNGSEHLRIDSSGNVGIGTSSMDFSDFGSNTGGIAIQDIGATNTGLKIGDGSTTTYLIAAGNGNCYQSHYGSGSMIFGVGNGTGTERLRIDSSGRLLVGTSNTVSIAGSSGFIQQHGNKSTCNIALAGYANNLGGPIIAFGASRSTTVGTAGVIVNSGDILGDIRFAGDDGTDINTTAASIRSEVDGTPGANDMPGRLVFSTTADGASSPTERLRLDSSGNVFINGTTAASAEIALNANGSAEFAGAVQIGGNPTVGVAAGAKLYAGGTFHLSRASGGVTTADIFRGYATGNSSPTSQIASDGSASFAGTVTAQGTVLTSDQRFKENITDAKAQLADVTALGNSLRNWDWTADAPVADKDARFLGLVAQEAETICPGIVTTIARTKDGDELTPEVVVPAVYETRTVPAVLDEEGEVVEAETTEEVLITEEQVTPATYEQLDDSYKGIKNDILIMKLLGAVAELSAKVAALEAG